MLKKQKEATAEAVKQISIFQKGEIVPLKTGISHLDYHSMGGLYPGTVLGIVALSGHGKTWELESIMEGVSNNNNSEDFVVLNCNWEIETFKQIVRDLSKSTGKTVEQILLNLPSDADKMKYSEALVKHRKDNVYIQSEPANPKTFIEDVTELIQKYPDKQLIVSIDNLENVLTEGKNQKEVMDDIIRAINILKKQHKYIVFIILNQMNREIESRTDPVQHFPRESDIYGTSSFFKLCDIVFAKHLPYKLGIKDYGLFPKDRFKYLEQSFIKEGAGKNNKFLGMGNGFIHYLKSRSVGEEYDRKDLYGLKIFDAPEPPARD